MRIEIKNAIITSATFDTERSIAEETCEMSDPKLIVILPTMTVHEIAQLCEIHNAYVRIESTGGKLHAYMEQYRDDEHIPAFLRRQAS